MPVDRPLLPTNGLILNLNTFIDQLRDFDSALLANTLGYIDPTPPEEVYIGGDIGSLTPTLGPTVGLAVTARIDTSTPGNAASMDLFWRQVERIEAMRQPVIWVVQTVGSRPDHECVLGDGMAKLLHAAGCIGAVSNGRARDIAGLHTTPFAFYGRGLVIHHCHMVIREIDIPVEVGGLTIQPDDLIHASSEGVIRIPRRSLERLVQMAPAMRAFEHEAHMVFRRTDLPVAEKRGLVNDCLQKHGFGGGPSTPAQFSDRV